MWKRCSISQTGARLADDSFTLIIFLSCHLLALCGSCSYAVRDQPIWGTVIASQFLEVMFASLALSGSISRGRVEERCDMDAANLFGDGQQGR